MIQDLIQYINTKQLLKNNKFILLGISGGIDSMVMVDLFLKANIKFALAHCNFMLRGNESEEDEKFVTRYSKDNGIELFVKKMNTIEFAEENKISIQMAARELRIQFFEKLCLKNDYQGYATAHHKDDAYETFFINLIRGCGISGLHGILPRQGLSIHPMLFTNREDIKVYALKNEILYREDSSNSKTDYTRNKIRHQLLPILKSINPAINKVMDGNLERLRTTELVYQQKINETLDTFLEIQNNNITIRKTALQQLDYPEAYLYKAISKFGFNLSDTKQILESLNGQSGKQFFSHSHRLIIDRENLIISELPNKNDVENETHIKASDTHLSDPFEINIRQFARKSDFVPDPNPEVAFLDAHRLQFPLTLRKWEKGDSFIPLGMKGKKLLSDIFTDLKLSLLQKEEVYILQSSNHIVWVLGYRIDERYKINAKTKNIYRISFASSPDKQNQ